jgi:hypothetical protein
MKPSFRSLPTIPVSLPTFHDAVTAMLEIVLRVYLKMLHSVACSFLYGSQLSGFSGLPNKLSVVWFFNFQILLASGISSLLV